MCIFINLFNLFCTNYLNDNIQLIYFPINNSLASSIKPISFGQEYIQQILAKKIKLPSIKCKKISIKRVSAKGEVLDRQTISVRTYVYISYLNTYACQCVCVCVCVRIIHMCTKLFTLPKQLPSAWQVASVIFALLLKQHLRIVLQRRSQCLRCSIPPSLSFPIVRVCNLCLTFNKQYKFTVNNCLGFCL